MKKIKFLRKKLSTLFFNRVKLVHEVQDVSIDITPFDNISSNLAWGEGGGSILHGKNCLHRIFQLV